MGNLNMNMSHLVRVYLLISADATIEFVAYTQTRYGFKHVGVILRYPFHKSKLKEKHKSVIF